MIKKIERNEMVNSINTNILLKLLRNIMETRQTVNGKCTASRHTHTHTYIQTKAHSNICTADTDKEKEQEKLLGKMKHGTLIFRI